MNFSQSQLSVLANNFPFASLLIANKKLECGLNLVDFIHLERWLSWPRRPAVPDCQGRLYPSEELMERYAAARSELVEIFASSEAYRCPISLEDIYLMNAAIRHGALLPTLNFYSFPDQIRQYAGWLTSTQVLTSFLRDLEVLIAMSPASSETARWFTDVSGYDMSKTLPDYHEFLADKPGTEQEYGQLVERTMTWLLPVVNRFEDWMKAVGSKDLVDPDTWSIEGLRRVGFPESILDVSPDPAKEARALQDTMKNWLGCSAPYTVFLIRRKKGELR